MICTLVSGALVGWVGAYRLRGEKPFGNGVARKLQARADAYIRGLELAHLLDGNPAGGRAVILLDPRGGVAFACVNGETWLRGDVFAVALSDAVRRYAASGISDVFWAQGAVVRLTRVSGSAESLLCAEIEPGDRVVSRPVAELSHRKRQVVELAAFGATVPEIARSLCISENTVRTHLKQIYEALGVATRLELRALIEAIR